MSIIHEERPSGSSYVESIMYGRTLSDDSPVRPAECHWHMVFVRKDGEVRVVFVGPWTTAGFTYYEAGAEIPDDENAEIFVERLVRNDVLVRDPLVETVLRGQPHALSARAVRHRFLRVTGLSQSRIRQVERAQRAAALLRQGTPIFDTVYEIGYFDQPHMTRSLKRWVGHTPGQIVRLSNPG